MIGDVGIGESLAPSETTTPATQTPATQTPAPQTPTVQDGEKQEMFIPVVEESTPVCEQPPAAEHAAADPLASGPPSDPPAADA